MLDPAFGAYLANQMGELIVRDDNARACIVELVGQFRPREHRIDRHVHAARLEDAEEADVELRTVRQEDGDPVALSRAEPGEHGRETVAQPVEFAIGRRAPVEQDGRLVGLAARPVAQIFGERLPAQRKDRLPWHARRPELALQCAHMREIAFLVA